VVVTFCDKMNPYLLTDD